MRSKSLNQVSIESETIAAAAKGDSLILTKQKSEDYKPTTIRRDKKYLKNNQGKYKKSLVRDYYVSNKQLRLLRIINELQTKFKFMGFRV